jgi:hypothetical protein
MPKAKKNNMNSAVTSPSVSDESLGKKNTSVATIAAATNRKEAKATLTIEDGDDPVT